MSAAVALLSGATMEREGERSATMASAGPSRHLPVQEPSTRRGGNAALLSSVVNRRDASPRGRGSSQRVRAGAVAAAGANRRRSRKVRCAHARLCPGGDVVVVGCSCAPWLRGDFFFFGAAVTGQIAAHTLVVESLGA